MVTFEQEWDEYISSMYSRAVQTFRQTTSYELLNEKVRQMENDCKLNFAEDDHVYLEAWEEAFAHRESKESVFIYSQAYQDCIYLLKSLKII